MCKTVCLSVVIGCSVSQSVGERTPGRRSGGMVFVQKVGVSVFFCVPSARIFCFVFYILIVSFLRVCAKSW